MIEYETPKNIFLESSIQTKMTEDSLTSSFIHSYISKDVSVSTKSSFVEDEHSLPSFQQNDTEMETSYSTYSHKDSKNNSVFRPSTYEKEIQKSTSEILTYKENLLRKVSVSMNKLDEATRLEILDLALNVALTDGEFILKVALYSRQKLNLRSVSHFLLSFASLHFHCQFHFSAIYKACILTPSDWLAVANEVLHFTIQNYGLQSSFFRPTTPGSLPSLLRKAMVTKFEDFDEYQLAKHNRVKRNEALSSNSSQRESKEELFRLKPFSIKRLVRLLHIRKPVNLVLCILGKKYPETEESYRSHRLPGFFDESQVGSKFKLASPDTWEVAVSRDGNVKDVWEFLISRNKVPLMATLMNLCNIVNSQVSEETLAKICAYISNERTVKNSRLLPLKYYTAYNSLKKINKDNETVKKLQEALNKAINISFMKNLPSLRGVSLIFMNTSTQEMSYMMAAMIVSACEKGSLLIYNNYGIYNTPMAQECILDRIQFLAGQKKKKTNFLQPLEYLKEYIGADQWIDNIFFIHEEIQMENAKTLQGMIDSYRCLKNHNLNLVFLNMSAQSSSFKSFRPHSKTYNLSGCNERVLECLVRGQEPVHIVESLVQKPESIYKLERTPRHHWSSVKIFISSTFLDMIGERDMVTKIVLPELCQRARSLSLNLIPIDLRWGLETAQLLQSIYQEIDESSLFLCFLGERYGSKPTGCDLSITELEIRRNNFKNALFCLRNPLSLDSIPKDNRILFLSEDSADVARLNSLKDKIRDSTASVDVIDNYTAKAIGSRKNIPIMGEFQNLSSKIISSLWSSLQKVALEPTLRQDSEFIGRSKLVQEFLKMTRHAGGFIVNVVGDFGVGISSLLSHFASLSDVNVICYFNTNGTYRQLLNFLSSELGTLLSEETIDESLLNISQLSSRIHRLLRSAHHLIVVVDGFDELPLNWIPQSLSESLTLIISCHTDSRLHQNFKNMKRQHYQGNLHFFVVPIMSSLRERKELIRHFFKKRGKTLHESLGRNDLGKLAGKKDGGNLGYLAIVCSELASFGHFELLESFIDNLGSTSKDVVAQILEGLSKEVGNFLVAFVAQILLASPWGISRNHLELAIQMKFGKDFSSSSCFVLLSGLQSLLAHSVDVGMFALSPRILAFLPWTSTQSVRHILFSIFKNLYHQQRESTEENIDPLILEYNLYHAPSNQNPFANSSFIYHCAKSGNLQRFFDAYLPSAFVNDVSAFLRRHQSLLERQPISIYQLVHQFDVKFIENDTEPPSLKMIKITDFSSFAPDFSLESYINIAPRIATCISTTENLVAYGLDNGSINLCSLISNEEITILVGHEDSISALAFGKYLESFLVSGSLDGYISYWNYSTGVRMAYFQGHEKAVSGISILSKSLVVSTGLDGKINIYLNKSIISRLERDINIPISALQGYLCKEMIAVGYWNGSLLLWDLVHCKISAHLPSLPSSIQDISLSSSEDFLVVCDIEGTVQVFDESHILLHSLKLNQPTFKVGFLNSNQILLGTQDGSLKIWKPSQNSPRVSYYMIYNKENEGFALGFFDGTVSIYERGKIFSATPTSSKILYIAEGRFSTEFLITSSSSELFSLNLINQKLLVTSLYKVNDGLQGKVFVTTNKSLLLIGSQRALLLDSKEFSEFPMKEKELCLTNIKCADFNEETQKLVIYGEKDQLCIFLNSKLKALYTLHIKGSTSLITLCLLKVYFISLDTDFKLNKYYYKNSHLITSNEMEPKENINLDEIITLQIHDSNSLFLTIGNESCTINIDYMYPYDHQIGFSFYPPLERLVTYRRGEMRLYTESISFLVNAHGGKKITSLTLLNNSCITSGNDKTIKHFNLKSFNAVKKMNKVICILPNERHKNLVLTEIGNLEDENGNVFLNILKSSNYVKQASGCILENGGSSWLILGNNFFVQYLILDMDCCLQVNFESRVDNVSFVSISPNGQKGKIMILNSLKELSLSYTQFEIGEEIQEITDSYRITAEASFQEMTAFGCSNGTLTFNNDSQIFPMDSTAIIGLVFLGKENMASLSKDGSLKLWEIPSMKQIGEYIQGEITAMAACGNDKIFVGNMIGNISYINI